MPFKELDLRLTDFGRRLMCATIRWGKSVCATEPFDEYISSCAPSVVLPAVLVMVFEAVCGLQRVPFIYRNTSHWYAQGQTNHHSFSFFFFFLSPLGFHCINVKQNWPTMLNYVPARDAASPPTTRRNIGAKKKIHWVTTTLATIPMFYSPEPKPQMFSRHVDPAVLITRGRRALRWPWQFPQQPGLRVHSGCDCELDGTTVPKRR